MTDVEYTLAEAEPQLQAMQTAARPEDVKVLESEGDAARAQDAHWDPNVKAPLFRRRDARHVAKIITP